MQVRTILLRRIRPLVETLKLREARREARGSPSTIAQYVKRDSDLGC